MLQCIIVFYLKFLFQFLSFLVEINVVQMKAHSIGAAPRAPLHAAHTTLSLIVNITCTQLPLPSHWSRSPDSCPCSPPAPGHNQKSPYKCSHTSHLQILLTPSGRGILQDRHRWLLISSWTFLKTFFFKWSRFEGQISSNLIILIVSYVLNCFSVVALFLLHTFRSVSGRYKQKLQPYIPSTWGAMHCSALSPI